MKAATASCDALRSAPRVTTPAPARALQRGQRHHAGDFDREVGARDDPRHVKLVYANRDDRSVIFADELAALARAHSGRFEIVHSLDVRDGLLGAAGVERLIGGEIEADFYLCGPGAFMATVESALVGLGVPLGRIHIERFVCRPIRGDGARYPTLRRRAEFVPESITIVLGGIEHSVPYRPGQRLLHAARRAGLDPPFSCEEGYCSCCMAKLVRGKVEMHANECLSRSLLAEGWMLTCQSRCVSREIRIEYPD
jgi:3-ketosteroid 9alpha-monooxygenase subunit B